MRPETYERYKATISGWERTSNGTKIPVDVTSNTRLIYTDVFVNEKKICKSIYPNVSTEKTICTYDTNGSDDCGGYVGDPLTITESDGVETQIGIASFGPHTEAECHSETGYPDGFVRVTSYSPLINIWSD
ncbi:venom serine protease Bi-VSP-like [Cloeon dipterum]|uniref:venom serine protease Bi-VSP-like n=1 Tax=Cloeon dipterum TaxID=197152 RepID=UPI0032207E11